MFVIVDIKSSNLTSIRNAFGRIGAEIEVASSPESLLTADAVILPGVGAFKHGMSALESGGYVDVLRKCVLENKTPLMGICLGMQLLADESEEHGLNKGLGFVKGHVAPLEPTEKEYRVPNIGWYETAGVKNGHLLPEGEESESFYFVHSYHLRCHDIKDVAATISYSGRDITAIIERENIFGCQFHPEKSQDAGLNLLSRFRDHVMKIKK